MADLLASVRRLNNLGSRAIAEPFAGGAGASLSLLFLEETSEIYINDADPAICDFWWSLVSQPKKFFECLSKVEPTIEEWERQRKIYRGSRGVSRTQRGFSAFFLNRCNRSGIIANGGPIGGRAQAGKWKIDARFNRKELRRRCERISEYCDRINVSGHDALDFLDNIDAGETMFFLDPPYFEKGRTLYLDSLDEHGHQTLASRLKEMADQAWLLTYDDCPEIREMYAGWSSLRPYSLRYSAHGRRSGGEVCIVPKWMRLPSVQNSGLLTW